MSLFALGSLLKLSRFGLAAESCGGISPSIVDPPVLLWGFSDALFESIVVPLRQRLDAFQIRSGLKRVGEASDDDFEMKRSSLATVETN